MCFTKPPAGLYSVPFDDSCTIGNGQEDYDYYDESEYYCRNHEIQTLMVENEILRRNQAQRPGQSSQFIQGWSIQPL
jgi:hypothetical protein